MQNRLVRDAIAICNTFLFLFKLVQQACDCVCAAAGLVMLLVANI